MNDVRLPRLLDKEMKEIARIRPVKLSITQSMVPLSTAEMTVKGGEYPLQAGQFIELYDPSGSAGVFRIAQLEMDVGKEQLCRVEMEHALVTLADKVLFGYTEIGGADMTLGEVLEKLLAGQEHWQVGICEVSSCYAYSFENENLLTAILSLTGPLTEPVMWTFDFSTVPWTLNLLRLSTMPDCECRKGRSLQSARIGIDRTDLCTRLYPLGYGEGVDQLKIASVNGGRDYLDADTVSAWGTAEMVYVDRGITDAGTLLASARALLEKLKNPVITARVTAAELAHLTGERMDRFAAGDLLRLPINDRGLMMEERIVCVKRPDVFGNPALVEMTLANRPRATQDELARLTRRSVIGERYSQGAASEYGVHFGDNCDQEHPAELKFFIDDDAVHVNKVNVRFEKERFRGYAKGAAAGGKTTSTSEEGGEVTITQEQKIVSTEASTGVPIAGHSGATTGNTGFAIGTDGSTKGQTDAANAQASHSHGMSHYHNFSHMHGVTVRLTIPEMPLTLPAHRHAVSVPAHRHDPELGIFEAAQGAERVQVTVDGTEVPQSVLQGGSFDASAYLARDSKGRIQRGRWHVIRFTPDAPARIVADVHVRTFIRSVTGALL